MALRKAASLVSKPLSRQFGFSGQPLVMTSVSASKSRAISTTVFAMDGDKVAGKPALIFASNLIEHAFTLSSQKRLLEELRSFLFLESSASSAPRLLR